MGERRGGGGSGWGGGTDVCVCVSGGEGCGWRGEGVEKGRWGVVVVVVVGGVEWSGVELGGVGWGGVCVVGGGREEEEWVGWWEEVCVWGWRWGGEGEERGRGVGVGVGVGVEWVGGLASDSASWEASCGSETAWRKTVPQNALVQSLLCRFLKSDDELISF